MPMRPAHACAAPGCPRLVTGGGRSRCPEHTRLADRRRGNRHERGYGAEWERLSRAILERDGYRCCYCGGYARTVDHLLPKAHGGTDDPSNLVAACRRCNSAKGARG